MGLEPSPTDDASAASVLTAREDSGLAGLVCMAALMLAGTLLAAWGTHARSPALMLAGGLAMVVGLLIARFDDWRCAEGHPLLAAVLATAHAGLEQPVCR